MRPLKAKLTEQKIPKKETRTVQLWRLRELLKVNRTIMLFNLATNMRRMIQRKKYFTLAVICYVYNICLLICIYLSIYICFVFCVSKFSCEITIFDVVLLILLSFHLRSSNKSRNLFRDCENVSVIDLEYVQNFCRMPWP